MLDVASLHAFIMRSTTAHDVTYFVMKAKPARDKLLGMRFEEVPAEHVESAAFLFLHAVDRKRFKIWVQNTLSRKGAADFDKFVSSLLSVD